MNLINKFLWHYWWGQTEYLRQRLDELEAEENNMREDRKKIRARLTKAEARVITYAQIGGMR
jgi:predicted alpha-1,6-mannanase (GH76 family)